MPGTAALGPGENNTRKNSPHGERDPNMYIRMLNMTWYSKIVLKKIKHFIFVEN